MSTHLRLKKTHPAVMLHVTIGVGNTSEMGQVKIRRNSEGQVPSPYLGLREDL